MAAERNLETLLANLCATREAGEYVFVSEPPGSVLGVEPVATIREREGRTLVVARDAADRAGLRYDFVAAWLTLEVHSALDAVGLTAAVSARLAGAGISCNVIAGYHHDHLFVPVDRADEALSLLGSG